MVIDLPHGEKFRRGGINAAVELPSKQVNSHDAEYEPEDQTHQQHVEDGGNSTNESIHHHLLKRRLCQNNEIIKKCTQICIQFVRVRNKLVIARKLYLYPYLSQFWYSIHGVSMHLTHIVEESQSNQYGMQNNAKILYYK